MLLLLPGKDKVMPAPVIGELLMRQGHI